MASATDFEWREFFWVAHTTLGDRRLAAGLVPLTFAPEGRGDEPLADDELALVGTVIDRVDEAAGTAVRAVFAEYPPLQELFGFDEEEKAQFMPDLTSADDLYELMEVIGVFVHPISRAGEPYVGIEFSCSWDPEHGTGVLLNGPRVVAVGGADTAIHLWVAQRDLDSYEPPT